MFFWDLRDLIRREIGLALASKNKVKVDLFLGYSDFRRDAKFNLGLLDLKNRCYFLIFSLYTRNMIFYCHQSI